ncbi:hypothetical protein XELAEV_18024994mg [Xenopus laevis]|uniref:Uncharacterized protein n=1 Tax=Xenopus laevis TaxID=8355 RepID=A0A974CZ26_XENLA|nr:hypothetical protein XELAEV_18024994mg [Xenopus laevis]
MKSVFYSRFFILLPWVLIVVIIIDSDTRRSPGSGRVPSARYYPYWNRRVGRAALVRPRPSVPNANPGLNSAPHRRKNETVLPMIYVITPTYSRPGAERRAHPPGQYLPPGAAFTLDSGGGLCVGPTSAPQKDRL